jgi:hypothetical protein
MAIYTGRCILKNFAGDLEVSDGRGSKKLAPSPPGALNTRLVSPRPAQNLFSGIIYSQIFPVKLRNYYFIS